MRNVGNIKAAQSAVKFVSSKMTIGASNKGARGIAYVGAVRAGRSMSRRVGVAIEGAFELISPKVACVAAQRAVAGTRFKTKPDYALIAAIARGAESSGCGNCGEQAAVAFDFLVRAGIGPIDYMYRTDGDHAFVVIGRTKGSDPTAPHSWGDEAVVCDPWRGEVSSPQSILDRGWKVDSAFRRE